MFTMYSDSDVTALDKDLDDVLAKHDALPASVMLHALANLIETEARKLATLHENAERPLHEPDLVNRLETCAGIIDHTNPRIQCRGETGMHRLYEGTRAELETAQADIEALRARIADLESADA